MFKQLTAIIIVFTTMSTAVMAEGFNEDVVKTKVETLKSKGCEVPTPGWVDTDKEYTDDQIEYLQQQYINNVDKALSKCKG